MLIQGGSGGLGSYAVQYAKNVLQCYVIASCSTESIPFVQKLGADACVDYKSNSKFLMNDIRCRNMDLVFDPFAYLYRNDTFNSPLPVLAQNAQYLHIACSPHSVEECFLLNLQDPLKVST